MSFRDALIAAVYAKPCRRLAYLESTGTQYIDTGVPLTGNSRWRIEFGKPVGASDVLCAVFGARDSYGSANTSILFQSPSRMTYGVVVFSFPVLYSTVEMRGEELYIDDALAHTFPQAAFTTAPNALLFSAYSSRVDIITGAKAAISRCQIWQDGVNLTRDLVPVLDSAGAPCMYDQVTKAFYHNAGSGIFLYE